MFVGSAWHSVRYSKEIKTYRLYKDKLVNYRVKKTKRGIYLHEHGDRHGADSTRYRGDEGCLLLGSGKVNIAYDPFATGLGAVCEKTISHHMVVKG